jgi:WS/DGAT/MGAT family acyltransferase
MAAERFEGRMNPSDTTLWRIERDPALRTTIVGLSMLDQAPDWDRLRAVIADASVKIPRLRQRVVEPVMGPPRWVTDPGFDLDYHLRRIQAPAPGDLATVLALGATAAMGAFDKDRPLWEFTLIEGLEDGRAALLQKVHHSSTDGVGAVRMARLLFDDDPDAVPDAAPLAEADRGPGTPGVRGSESDPLKLAFDTAADQAHDMFVTVGKAAAAMPAAVAATMRDPAATVSGVLRSGRTVVRMLRPVRTPLSPIMIERSMSRRLAIIEVPTKALLDAGHAVDGTMNDAFLAAITGGMRRYHEHHGEVAEQLRVTMPINTRRDDDAVGNNRFTPARFTLPAANPDPEVRMHELGELARNWRREPGLGLTDVVATTLNVLPAQATAAVLGSMLKAIDFVATNVPGFDYHPYLAGARLESQHAFAPPSGAAVSVALLSTAERCSFGIVMDTAAVPDTDVFVQCLAEGVEEVVAVGRRRRRRARRS